MSSLPVAASLLAKISLYSIRLCGVGHQQAGSYTDGRTL